MPPTDVSCLSSGRFANSFAATRSATRSAADAPRVLCGSLTDAGARRVSVANLELRVPVVGALGVLRESGPLPIDAFVFADAGWFDSGAAAEARRSMLRSAGAGARLNAAGFVFEFAAARAQRGWAFAMNFRPGF